MTELKNHNRLIEAYLDRSIIELERSALEKAAANDPRLAQKIKRQREALMALEIISQDEARESLQQTLAGIKAARASKKRRWMQTSLAFLVTVVLGLGIWQGLPYLRSMMGKKEVVTEVLPPDPVSLSVAYFEPHEFDLQPSRTVRVHRLVERSQNAYQAAQYAEAIPELEALLKVSPRRADARLALGICWLALDSTSQAAQQFVPIIDRGKNHEEEARWYLALTYFRARMFIQAFGLMEQIANTEGHFKQKEAKEFLAKLKGVKG